MPNSMRRIRSSVIAHMGYRVATCMHARAQERSYSNLFLLHPQESALAKLTSTLSEAEAQAKGKAAQSSKVISSLEREVGELREQVKAEQGQREREVSDTKERAEEERESYIRIQEAAVSQFMLKIFLFKCRLSVYAYSYPLIAGNPFCV